MEQLINNTYRILEIIGKGGMSTVYKAEHVRLGTIWAVKQVSKNQKAKFDFLAEANILKKLQHPMLPKIVDIFEDNHYLYVVEDYVAGDNLETVLKRQIKFDEKIGLIWFKRIAECLGYLHNQKPNPIIYRDMKPSNIMIQPDGNLKLIDFGIAREYKEEAIADTTFVGTKGYMAPEQAGKAQSDARTDIYSLGVTMYHILSGKSPYEPPYRFIPIRELNPELSVGIETIIDRCIQQEPEDRYASTKELIEDLDHIYRFEETYQKFIKRKRYRKLKLWLMGGMSIILILAGFVVKKNENASIYQQYINSAQQLIDKQPMEALSYLEEAQKLDSKQTSAYILKARAYYNALDYDQCIAYITEIQTTQDVLKQDQTMELILASAYFEKEKYPEAVACYEKLLRETENPDENLSRDYAVALAMNGNIDNAEMILDQLQDEGADKDLISYISGSISYSLKKYGNAEQSFKDVINQTGNTTLKRKSVISLAAVYRDAALISNSEIENARTKEIELINQSIQKDGWSNDSILWEMLGAAYYNRAIYETDKDYDDLISSAKAFQQILDLNIQKKYIYVNIFIAYQQAGEYEQALTVLDKMESAYPDAYEANAYRATLYIVIENEKPQEKRNYWPAYEEYQNAKKKIKDEDNDSQFVQLQGLIDQLKKGHWLD